MQLTEGGEAFFRRFAAHDVGLLGKPAGAAGLELLERGFIGSATLLFRSLPLLDQRFDVALEDFGQIVVAVELVFVGQASEGADGICDGHGWVPCSCSQRVSAASTRI